MSAALFFIRPYSASRALQIPFELGVWVGLVSILMCSMLGGMRAVTWTQVAQYIVLITAYLIPVFWMGSKLGNPFPHFMLGDEVQRLAELEGQFGLTKNTGAAIKEAGVPGGLKYISILTLLYLQVEWLYGNTYRLRSV